jgi:uncharacterized membrane protein
MLKTVTYGLMHFCVAILVAFALTRDLRAALAIGLIEPVIQTIAYMLHEKVWQKFRSPGAGPSPTTLAV